MGIYPVTSISGRKKYADGTESWTEEVKTPDLIRRRTVTASAFTEERITCFCCSCDTDELSDPYCRNHGFAGARPCESHGMPGEPNEDGVMPLSVEKRELERREAVRLIANPGRADPRLDERDGERT